MFSITPDLFLIALYNYILLLCVYIYIIIIERLDRGLTKYIYNILHSDNNVIKTIVHSKLYMSPKSIIAENYKYISYKYLTLTGQRVSVMSLIKLQFLQIPKVLHYVTLLENYVKFEMVQNNVKYYLILNLLRL